MYTATPIIKKVRKLSHIPTPAEATILNALSQKSGQGEQIGVISKTIERNIRQVFTQGAIRAILERLAQQGFVETDSKEKKLWRLTVKGEELYTELQEFRPEVFHSQRRRCYDN